MPTSRARDKTPVSYFHNRTAKLAQLIISAGPGSLPAQFASFATTIQTRIDNNGAGSPAALNGSVEAQVERALSQVMRQGGAPEGAGSVAISLGPTGASNAPTGYGSPGLSTAQAVLVGEAAVVQADLLAALDSLEPLSTIVDASDIAAYRSIVRAEVLALTTEFARPDQPRPIRVRVLFGGLLGWAYAPGYNPLVVATPSGDIAALVFLLNLGAPVVPSALTEDQAALQGVLSADAARLFDLWANYQYAPPLPLFATNPPVMWSPETSSRPSGIGGVSAVSPIAAANAVPYLFGANTGAGLRPAMFSAGAAAAPPPPFSFSERMIRADLLLPVLSRDCDQVAGALDAVGFGPGSQEVTPMPGLQSDADSDFSVVLPVQMAQQQQPQFGPTVKDILEWASDLASGSGYDLLRQAGQLGLDLLADQADELFWIVAAVIQKPPLPELGDAQVGLELRNLARDLSALADLCN